MRTSPITVSAQGYGWLRQAQKAWTELLHDSDANKLFLSWTWIKEWWDQARAVIDGEPVILTACSSDGRLVGILPLYLERTRLRGLKRVRRLQLIGNCWTRSDLGLITEYLGPVIRNGWLETVSQRLTTEMLGLEGWDEFCPQYVCSDSPFSLELAAAQRGARYYVRALQHVSTYGVVTTGRYADYLASLKRKVRRRLYNQRSQLDGLGGAEIEFADVETLPAHLRNFEALHRARWKSGSSPGRQMFCERLCRHLLAEGQLRFSLLRIGGRVVSSMLNAFVDGVEYNLRLAIHDGAFKQLSTGFLHLGYVLERAFAENDTVRFDLLAGAGKRMDYKGTIAAPAARLAAFQLVRAKDLRWRYRARDVFVTFQS